MKKVLIVSTQCISSPLNKNGYGGSLYCMVKAQKDYDIDFLYIGEKDDESESEMQNYYSNLYHVNLKRINSKMGLFINLLNGIPKLTSDYNYSKVNCVEDKYYDIAIYDTISSLPMRDYIKADKHIAFMIDSTNMYYLRRSKTGSFINRLYSKIQAHFLLETERKFFEKVDKLVFVSKVDAMYENRINPLINKFFYVNNGVFINEIDESNAKTDMGVSLIFTGIMDYGPNKDAVDFLVNDIFPEIKEKYTDVKLYLVGKNKDGIKQYEREDIIVTGCVENIYSYIKGAMIYVSPLRFGTGMKNKILEAMACKTPIVASKVSVEGIDELTDNENILIASTKEEWIDRISLLLQDQSLRKKYSDLAYNIAKENYSWNSAMKQLIE